MRGGGGLRTERKDLLETTKRWSIRGGESPSVQDFEQARLLDLVHF